MLKIEELREIIELIDASSINEFSYETEDTKVKLKKQAAQAEVIQVQKTVESVAQEQVKTPTVQSPVKVDGQNSDSTDRAETAADGNIEFDYEIVSPMVGTLYSASSPGKDPFVTKGSTVSKDSVVCIVEAMKLFNEIEAEVSGEIVEVLVEDGELVEYGQPLYRVKTK